MKKNSKSSSRKRVFWSQIVISISFVMILLTSVVITVTYSLQSSTKALKNRVSKLVSSIDIQMELNINNHLEAIQQTSTLAFSPDPIYKDVIAYKYDPIDENYSEYDKIQINEAFSNKLVDLSLMENYSDFAVVYSDNSTIGKISKSTSALYGTNLYQTMDDVIGNSKTGDGWYSGYGNDFIRIYYAKRMNKHAILVTSFYITELESIFARPENMNSLAIRLIDTNDTVIYSSEDKDTGKPLDKKITNLIGQRDSVIITDNNYIVSVATCGDNWRIICSIPTAVVLAEIDETRHKTYIIAAIASLIAVLVSVTVTWYATRPVKKIVDNLNSKADNDLLTGIYNKITFENKSDEMLKNAKPGDNYSLFVIDIDNFKNVNDTQGHSFGDTVIVGVARLLKNAFLDVNGFCGRIGGDEFAVFIKIPEDIEMNTNMYNDYIDHFYTTIKKKLDDFGRLVGYNVTLSIGVGCEGKTYKELFQSSDNALYISKKSGKNKMTKSVDIVKGDIPSDAKNENTIIES